MTMQHGDHPGLAVGQCRSRLFRSDATTARQEFAATVPLFVTAAPSTMHEGQEVMCSVCDADHPPAPAQANGPVIICPRRPHEHAAGITQRCAGYTRGAAEVNGKRARNPYQLGYGLAPDAAKRGHLTP